MNNYTTSIKNNKTKNTTTLEINNKLIKQLHSQGINLSELLDKISNGELVEKEQVEANLREILSINDKNIQTLGVVTEETTKHGKVKVIKAKLSYTPSFCEHCKCENINYTIVRNGSRLISVNMGRNLAGELVKLALKKQRFKCTKCNRTFVARTTLVPKYKNISNIVSRRIAIELSEVQNLQKIASTFGVSTNTVQRVLNELGTTLETVKALPLHLSFDELKTTKDVSGAMSFIYTNAQTHEIIDIVMDRRLRNLKQYFIRIPWKVRKQVKTITIDMYSPYVSLIKDMFPKAKIIIDKFHIIQHINREFNKLRIKTMNRVKNNNHKLYTRYKKYWKLLLKDIDDLKEDGMYVGKELVVQKHFVLELVKEDKQLELAYNIMQELRDCLNKKDYTRFEMIINKKWQLPKGIRKVVNTFKKYSSYIKNTLDYSYTNGHLEGINNKLKLIKRVAFGYRKFENFRTRALVIFRILKQQKQEKEQIVNKNYKAA